MEYKKLNDCWSGLKNYNLNGNSQIYEHYNPVTMDYADWKNYLGSGSNVLYGDAIKASGNSGAGAVIGGHVRQNVMTANSNIQGPVYDYEPGLAWIN